MTDALTARDLILTALRAQPHLDVFDGAVNDAGEPPFGTDPDGRTHMGAVLWMGIGSPDDLEQTMCGDRPLLSYGWQVTCVGGDSDRALRAALKVRAALTGQHLAPDLGACRELLDRPTVRQDPAAKPARWFLPIVYTAAT